MPVLWRPCSQADRHRAAGDCGRRASGRACSDGRHIPCACRPVATSGVPTASSRQRGAAGGACRLDDIRAEVSRTRRRRLQGASSSPACISARTAAISRPPASLADLLRLLDDQPGELLFRISSLEPMDCTPDGRSARWLSSRAVRAALPPAAAARAAIASCGPWRGPIRARRLRAAGQSTASAAAGRRDRRGRDRRIPGREPMPTSGRPSDYLLGSPLTYLHVFPYSDRPGTAAVGFRSRVPSAEIGRAHANCGT